MGNRFEDDFTRWLDMALVEDIPTGVEAFCFNLFLPAGEENVIFGIELIGADRFDKSDDDWACDEVWEPKQRSIFISIEYSTDDWEICQLKMKKLIKSYLDSMNKNITVLEQLKAIAIGFVDGSLDLIWVKD
jgi:hypothetical protein